MITSKLPKPDTTPACSNTVAEFIPKMCENVYFVLLGMNKQEVYSIVYQLCMLILK